MHSVRKDHEACMQVHQEKLMLAGGIGVPREEGGGNAPVISAEESANSFQEYLQCSKQVVLKKCGSETANFTERFLDRMASPLMELHCEGHDVGSDKCEGFRNLSEGFSSASHLSLSLLSIFAPLLLSRILFSST
ncbi:hypothetical protein J437_LFUL014529 [Ladona fulva]|uniref:Uncharacterized protein n=1 Tax=Ladona fulva TaxID=123851 RepID=A0A8K0KHV6_LADFU|nr:hypothetical protein J437_LFUL014529 [Ladona fulva]